jgi:hypothetical protein
MTLTNKQMDEAVERAEADTQAALAHRARRNEQHAASVAKACIPVVSKIKCRMIDLVCPHCGAIQEGWITDPRGREAECDDCGKKYGIAIDPQITFG